MTCKHCQNFVPHQFSSVQSLICVRSLRPHELQHTRPQCPSPTPGVHSNSCPSSRWCHSAVSSSVVPLSSCPQSLQASGSFPISQLFAWGGQSIGVSELCYDAFKYIILLYGLWTDLTWRVYLDIVVRCIVTKGEESYAYEQYWHWYTCFL